MSDELSPVKKWKSVFEVGDVVSRSATQSPATIKPITRRSKTPTPRSKTPTTPLSPPPRSAGTERSLSPFKYGKHVLQKGPAGYVLELQGRKPWWCRDHRCTDYFVLDQSERNKRNANHPLSDKDEYKCPVLASFFPNTSDQYSAKLIPFLFDMFTLQIASAQGNGMLITLC